ncbi:Hypothetical predicted protein [Olea europaea subsp. europaea]|uniref:Uncharacterized protein n=1 Tax=Olea europaea subsp. europaea TaxID=158383 RepID=A0A8S0VFB8_OLEEU|nr:Hypothetical predicted protein [Olea europaea subsp. europaea]
MIIDGILGALVIESFVVDVPPKKLMTSTTTTTESHRRGDDFQQCVGAEVVASFAANNPYEASKDPSVATYTDFLAPVYKPYEPDKEPLVAKLVTPLLLSGQFLPSKTRILLMGTESGEHKSIVRLQKNKIK